MIKIKLPTQKGRKRRFLIYGALNVGATNLFLQLLLIIFNTGFSTFLSQIFNMILGFFLYGKKVFRVNNLKQAYGFKYLILATSLWLANWPNPAESGFSQNILYFPPYVTKRVERTPD